MDINSSIALAKLKNADRLTEAENARWARRAKSSRRTEHGLGSRFARGRRSGHAVDGRGDSRGSRLRPVFGR